MSDVPVIFEIDPDTHEALGDVHFFCSYQFDSENNTTTKETER